MQTRGTSVMWAPDRIDRPDDVDVLLERRGHDHLGRLAEARVDDLEALVAQAAREDLRPAVVAVEAGLGDQHLERSIGHKRDLQSDFSTDSVACESPRVCVASRSRRSSAAERRYGAVATTANIVRRIENWPRRAAAWIAATNVGRSVAGSRSRATRSSARLSIEKQPTGAGEASGSQLVHVCVASALATGSQPAAATRSCSRRPMLDGRPRSVRIASRTSSLIASSPTSILNVDQSVSINEMRRRAHDPDHLGDRSLRAREPLQRPFGSGDVECVVGLVERARVARGEPNVASRRPGVGPGDAQHLLGLVDADDLAAIAEVLGERQRCLAKRRNHIEQSFTVGQGEAVPLPRPQAARRVPTGRPLHRGNEHGDVRVSSTP